jgi:PAS domain S-box-containing protein
MDGGLVKTGIDIISEVPWGTHFCQFYQTREDLLDTLVPYFKAGLEGNEFCMWITSDPLSAEEASQAMHRAIPDFADRLDTGQIEILAHTDWYLKGGSFDQQRVLDGWVEKLNGALAAGYAGLRLSGNTFWLEKQDWKSFTDYEAAVNDVIGKYRMLALCTYSLDKCGAAEVMDVIRNHEFALIRKEGEWEIIENAVYKQAKQAVLESEKKYRQLMESLQEGVWVIDKDACTTFVNPRMAEMLGYSVDEMPGKPLFSFIDESNLRVAGESMERWRRGIKVEVEFNFRCKDGSQLWTLISAAPLTDISGDFSGVIAGIVDITERKRFEVTLRESEERYRTIVETSQEGIVIGSPDGRFVFVNQRMADMLGYAKEELLGKTGLDFMDDDQKGLVTSSRRRLEEGQTVHAEYKFCRRDGSTMWTLCSATAMYDETGRYLGNLAMHNDITERKRREQNILRLTQLYAVLSRANEAIVRIGDARSLYSEICRIVAEESGFPLVWIGQLEEHNVVPLAWFGPAADYVKEIKVELQGDLGAGPTGTCIRENRAVVNNDFATNATVSRWREVASNYRFRASAAFPLRRDGKAIGALSLYSLEPNAFDADQIRLLESLASDVSYALDSIGREERRVHAEETLRASEDRLNRAQEIAHIGGWELDLLNNRLSWSDEVYRIFGLQPQEFTATYEAFLEGVHPDDRPMVDAAYSSSVREGKDAYEIEHRIVRKSDGAVRFVHEKCEHIRDESGRIVRSLGMVHDITERKMAEESLRETRDYLDSLLNNANAPVIVWDPELRITRFNRAFQRLTGHRESEALGQRLDMLFPKESLEESLLQIYRAMAGERWDTVEIPILRVDGEVRTVLWNSANIHASDGVTTVATIAQGQDITERKLTEKALRDSEERHRLVFEAAMDGFWVADLSGRLLQVNDSYCQMSGYARQELLGMRISDIEAVEKPEETAQHIKKVLEQGQDRFETRHRRKDGGLIDIEVSVKHLDVRGGQLVVSARDITDRRKAEEQLEFQVNILSNLFDAVVAVDNDYRVTYWNRIAEDLYGVPAEKAIGRKAENLYQQVWLNSKDEQDYANDLATRGHWTGENIHVKNNGERIYVRSSVSMILDEDGARTGAVSVIRDRTRLWQAEQEVKILNERLRQQAEERLRATDASFRLAITSSADGIIVVRKDGIIRFANPAAEALLGWEASTTVGTLFGFPLNERAEIEIPREDGSKAIAEMRIVELDWEGTPAYLATLRDVTRRKQGQLALQESETRLRLLLDQIPCLTWTLDTKLRFTSFAGSGSEVFEAVPGQVLGMTLADYFKVDDLDFAPYVTHRQALQGTPATYELSWAGRTFYGRVESLRDADDHVVGVVGVAFDITDRKRAEEQLRNLSHRLVSAQENERRKIARELHDEVGQSLTALKLCLDKISLSSSAGDGSELGEARKALRELMAQVRSMSLELRPTMLDDLGLLPTLLWHFKRYTAQTNVQVHFKHRGLRRDLPQETVTTAYRIVQEALTNVARYAQVDEVLVVVRAEQDALLVEVEDQGVGFEIDDVASSSSGLNGMRERALSLNGKLLVQSKPGEGTCVIAELPLTKRRRRTKKEQRKR